MNNILLLKDNNNLLKVLQGNKLGYKNSPLQSDNFAMCKKMYSPYIYRWNNILIGFDPFWGGQNRLDILPLDYCGG